MTVRLSEEGPIFFIGHRLTNPSADPPRAYQVTSRNIPALFSAPLCFTLAKTCLLNEENSRLRDILESVIIENEEDFN